MLAQVRETQGPGFSSFEWSRDWGRVNKVGFHLILGPVLGVKVTQHVGYPGHPHFLIPDSQAPFQQLGEEKERQGRE